MEEETPCSANKVGQDNSVAQNDPLRNLPVNHVQDGEHALLVFADGRQIFAHCVLKPRGQKTCLKISKRSYGTANLVGLTYGTVLELTPSGLVALSDGEGLLPDYPLDETAENEDALAEDTTFPPIHQPGNQHFVDDNTSQALKFEDLQRLKEQGTDGSLIVQKIIRNSATFERKTEFSKAKYVTRKQLKYQQRCRLVRCTASSICEAQFLRDPKRLMNMRDDTLGQILSYSNVSAGCQALIFEDSGVITGAVAQRLGGYGRILTLFSGHQPGWTDVLQKFNLSYPEQSSIRYLHTFDVFGEDIELKEEEDLERTEREALKWPCPLQPHTRAYLKSIPSQKARDDFLAKRCSRFARKLTRHTPQEAKIWLDARQSDTIILATRYDPTATLLKLLPFLAPSSPFVVFCEFMEPLTQCFQALQELNHAINLRLSDTWTREYQILPGRTHPNMNMSQSGGFILTGIKLDPKMGRNTLDDVLLKEIRAEIGGRRGKKKRKPAELTNGEHEQGNSCTEQTKPFKARRTV